MRRGVRLRENFHRRDAESVEETQRKIDGDD